MKQEAKNWLGRFCPLEHCPWQNNGAGHCLWPGDWCPREGDIERHRRQQADRRWREMKGR